MNLPQLLDHLDHHHVEVRLHGAGVRLVGRRSVVTDPEVVAAVRAHKAMLRAREIGTATGHVPAFCTTCGSVLMTAHVTPKGNARTARDSSKQKATAWPVNTWPDCVLTPGCAGHHEPRPTDLERLRRLGAPPPPAQPGAAGSTKPGRGGKERRTLGPWPTYPTPGSTAA